MRLIDADDFYERMKNDTDLCAEIEKDGLKALKKYLDMQPTAYDIDKVAEESETLKEYFLYVYNHTFNSYDKGVAIGAGRIIEIIKQGGVNIRKDCEYRHKNGNCLKVGGFCTSVNDKHCEKMKQGGISDDVCEWKYGNTYPHYTVGCVNISISIKYGSYCPYCGKKIKVVE